MNAVKQVSAVVAAVLAASGVAAAHSGHNHAAPVDPDPGVISASSPVYGLDVAADRVMVGFGVVDRGAVAFERASEVSAAVDAGNDEARERAESDLNAVASAATNTSTSGLAKAQAVLEAVQDRAPDEADDGLSQALDEIEAAQQRQPDDPMDQSPERPAGNMNAAR